MKPIYMPKNLDLEVQLKTTPPKFKYHIDNFKYILNAIVSRKIILKAFLDEEFTALNAKKLQKKIRAYNEYLAYLIDNGIIETDNQYIVGSKSRGYRIASEYRKEGFRIDNISKIQLTGKRIGEWAKDLQFKADYHYLLKWFNSKLKIKVDAAKGYLKQLWKQDIQQKVNNADDRYLRRLATVETLDKGIYHTNVDTTVKRFNSNLTNIKSDLRDFITYDGQQLCAVDVKNSQPFISTVLLAGDFYNPQHKGVNLYSLSKELFHEISPYIPSIRSLLPHNPSIMLVKSELWECKSDLETYCTLVDKGQLYEHICSQYNKQTGAKLDISNPTDKRMVKQAVFTTMFSDNRFFGQPDAKMKRFFESLFPTVYKVFSSLKRGDNARLAVILQRIESEVTIRRAARRIGEERPDLPIFTIHDSIVSLTSEVGYVEGILKDEFQKAIGLKPGLACEIWAADK